MADRRRHGAVCRLRAHDLQRAALQVRGGDAERRRGGRPGGGVRLAGDSGRAASPRTRPGCWTGRRPARGDPRRAAGWEPARRAGVSRSRWKTRRSRRSTWHPAGRGRHRRPHRAPLLPAADGRLGLGEPSAPRSPCTTRRARRTSRGRRAGDRRGRAAPAHFLAFGPGRRGRAARLPRASAPAVAEAAAAAARRVRRASTTGRSATNS